MTRWLRCQGHDVAFCTVERIMRELGLHGVVRGRKHRTTIRAKDGVGGVADWPPRLVTSLTWVVHPWPLWRSPTSSGRTSS